MVPFGKWFSPLQYTFVICVKYRFSLLSVTCQLYLLNPLITIYRHLAGEIAQEWETLGEDDDARRAELISEAHVIVPYHMQHNAEAEACDLLMEMEQLELLTSQDYVDKVKEKLTRVWVCSWNLLSEILRILVEFTRHSVYMQYIRKSKCNRTAI